MQANAPTIGTVNCCIYVEFSDFCESSVAKHCHVGSKYISLEVNKKAVSRFYYVLSRNCDFTQAG